jgi:predicted CDP-diglyceride synthetase/phosphatidate cytidylyltransferase
MITVYCISHVPALLLLKIPGYGGATPLLMFYLLLVVQMSNVLQYVCGKLFGHTKIAPAVSPPKTVEGLSAAPRARSQLAQRCGGSRRSRRCGPPAWLPSSC